MLPVADEARCTCGNAGNPTVIDAWYPSHRPSCMAWCDCLPPGVPATGHTHSIGCGAFAEES